MPSVQDLALDSNHSFLNSVDGALAAPLPTYTNDQIADFLVYNWFDGAKATIGPTRTLTVNIERLTPEGKILATAALQAWTYAAGITFEFVDGYATPAYITFDDEKPGASTSIYVFDNKLYNARVNISKDWIDNYGVSTNSYSFQTYMHEIGHALGLGHAGNYDGSATYAEDGSGDNHYLNDSWRASVMSYFDTNENTSVESWPSGVFLGTPMIADILATQLMYNINYPDRQLGDTIYGEGTNLDGYLGNLINSDRAFMIVDDGGNDTINFSSETANQIVDLAPGAFSSVGGLIANMVIMRDTIIENFISGFGNDSIFGNVADNELWAGGGDDLIKGKTGADTLHGGSGNDIIYGNAQADLLIGNAGDDILHGNAGKDVLFGGSGQDVLMGGIGRDKLFGGAGEDTFVFKEGWAVDAIRDFEDDIDSIKLDSSLWRGGAMDVSTLLATYGSSNVANNGNAGFHVELDFGGGDILKIHGITNVNVLLDDIILI